ANTLSGLYAERAIVPAFAWLGGVAPAAPQVVIVPSDGGAASFTITAGDSVLVRWWLIQTRGRDGVWTTAVRPAGEGKLGVAAFGTNDPDEIAVTAIGVTGIASAP